MMENLRDISNSDILLARFAKCRQGVECTLLVGTYVELVDRKVVLKQKELLVNTEIGVIKTKTDSARRRAVLQADIPVTSPMILHHPALCSTTGS